MQRTPKTINIVSFHDPSDVMLLISIVAEPEHVEKELAMHTNIHNRKKLHHCAKYILF